MLNIILSSLEIVIYRKLILLWTSSIVKCIVGVKVLNVFSTRGYSLHCSGKLWECHQHIRNTLLCGCFMRIWNVLVFSRYCRWISEKKDDAGAPIARPSSCICCKSLYWKQFCFIKIVQIFVISHLSSLFNMFRLHVCSVVSSSFSQVLTNTYLWYQKKQILNLCKWNFKKIFY
jgi:hypothetical protein